MRVRTRRVPAKSFDYRLDHERVQQQRDRLNTRVNTLGNAGYITTPALQAYSCATTGQLADYALASTVDTNTTTLSGSVLPAILALQQQVIPTTSSILNDANVGATATSGATANVTMTNKSSGTGVDFTVSSG